MCWALVGVFTRKALPLPLAASAFLAVQVWAYIVLVAMTIPAFGRYGSIGSLMIIPMLALLLSWALGLRRKAKDGDVAKANASA